MCESVIAEVKIRKVYYILEKNKEVNKKIEYIKINKENDIFKKELKKFFELKR